MKVLLGIGGSDDSFRALERVVERAAEAGDDLTVAVLENPANEKSPDEITEMARDVIQSSDLGTVDVRQLAGDPGPALVDLAEREDFEQIVLGGGQRSPMGKIKIGSIAEFVLLNATTTVTLVR